MAVILQKIRGNIGRSVYEALDKLRYTPLKSRIFIKPNIVDLFKPDEPYITNPQIVGGVIDYLKDKEINNIIVGEEPVGKNAKKIFKTSGYTKLCQRKNVRLIDLNGAERMQIKFRDNNLLLPKVIFEREYINISKFKTHIQTMVSLGLKNQKGLLSFLDRKQFHKDLHSNIAHLANIVRPNLSIIDATNGIEGNGPGGMGREVKNIDLLICGTDFLATDVVATRLMGIEPQQVPHLAMARNLGVGSFDSKIIGRDLKKLKMNFLLPSNHHRIFNSYYWWTDEICSGCSSLMGKLKKEVFKRPPLLIKLFYYGFFKRLDFVTGNLERAPHGYNKVICIGDCTRKFARRYNFPIAYGCPPKAEDIKKFI